MGDQGVTNQVLWACGRELGFEWTGFGLGWAGLYR